MLVTTTFVPNDLTGGLTGYAGIPRIARAGGVSRGLDVDVFTFLSNETGWYGSAPSTGVVGAARDIGTGLDKRWRGMFRFLLRSNTLDQSSILSGPTPDPAWWINTSTVEFRWFNGDVGPAESGPPPNNMSSDLLIYGGRGLHTVTSGNENPFGRNSIEAASDFSSAVALDLMATVAYADWAMPIRTYKSVFVPAAQRDAYFKTVIGDFNAYFDISFVVFKEGVDGVNFKQEFAAYGGFQPMLIVTWNLPDAVPGPGGAQVVALAPFGAADSTAGNAAIAVQGGSEPQHALADSGSETTITEALAAAVTTFGPVPAMSEQPPVSARADFMAVSVSGGFQPVDVFAGFGAIALVAPKETNATVIQ